MEGTHNFNLVHPPVASIQPTLSIIQTTQLLDMLGGRAVRLGPSMRLAHRACGASGARCSMMAPRWLGCVRFLQWSSPVESGHSPQLSSLKAQQQPLALSDIPRQPLLVRCWLYVKDLLLIGWRVTYLGVIFFWPLITAPWAYLGPGNLRVAWWRWLRGSIVRSGPCATKLAQWIATRPDLFPGALVDELASLQSRSAQHTVDETTAALDVAFGEAWRAELTLDAGTTRALGSGCVASVFRGTLQPLNGVAQPVAIKIVHPDVSASIHVTTVLQRSAVDRLLLLLQADLRILKFGAGTLECIPGVCTFGLSESVAQFAALMLDQLDLSQEAAALDRLRHNFASTPSATFPKPVDRLVSASVLVESFVEGELMSEFLKREGHDAACKQLAASGVNALMKMVFVDNFVHADLHPGNIIVQQQGGKAEAPQLVMIDTGIISELSRANLRNLLELFEAVIKNDGTRAGQLMIERSGDGGTRCVRPKDFELEMTQLIDSVHAKGLTLGNVGVSSLLRKVLNLCYVHQVQLEAEFVSVVIAVGVMEGLVRRLDPDVDLFTSAAPWVARGFLANKFRRD